MGQTEGWRQELTEVLDALDHAVPGAVRAVYLHGSRAEGASLVDSDIDLTVVVNDPGGMVQVGRALGNRTLSSGQKLDAHVDTVESLADPYYSFPAARLKYSGDLIRGEDVRGLVPEPDYARFRSAVLDQACKGIGMLRDVDQIDPPIDYPNSALPFFGYTIVRKHGWYPANTNEGTKELVAVATFCASAWVVTHANRWITSKAQALSGIREIENDGRADLVERLYRLCRLADGGNIPASATEQTELTTLCERFLPFENEVLGLKLMSAT